jgi:predicted nucleic acid-binding protein
VDLLFTRITVEELAKIADEERRVQLLLILVDLGRMVPVYGIVLGHWRLGFDLLTDGDGPFDTLAGETTAHIEDSLIGATADYEGCILVTSDRRLTSRARAAGIRVGTPAELLRATGFVQ